MSRHRGFGASASATATAPPPASFGFSSGYQLFQTSGTTPMGSLWSESNVIGQQKQQRSHGISSTGTAPSSSDEIGPSTLPPPPPIAIQSNLRRLTRPTPLGFSQSLAGGSAAPGAELAASRARGLTADSFLTDKQRQERQRQRRLEENYKTVMCDFMRTHKFCMFGDDCRYAHSVDELRPKMPAPNHKTILCRNFSASGACPYGRKCRYIHRSADEVANLASSSSESSAPEPESQDSMSLFVEQLNTKFNL